jgi:hypothetical protein
MTVSVDVQLLREAVGGLVCYGQSATADTVAKLAAVIRNAEAPLHATVSKPGASNQDEAFQLWVRDHPDWNEK